MVKKTRRKPARRAAPQRSGIGAGWWLTAIVAVGLAVHGANPALFRSAQSRVEALLAGEPKREPARTAGRPAPERKVEPAPRREASRVPAEPTRRSPDATSGQARAPAANPVPAANVPVRPTVRPVLPTPRVAAVPTGGRAPALTAARTPLHAEPSARSGVRTTLEAGRALKVIEARGTWRRVEAGIFTGWIEADALRGTGTGTGTGTRNGAAALPAAMTAPTVRTPTRQTPPRPQADVTGSR